MNPEDYAIIIGLEKYPGLGDLGGPENDARAFRDWVISPTGGGVPDDSNAPNDGAIHLQLILSSGFQPPFANVLVARPAVSEIQKAFLKLHTIYETRSNAGQGTRIGRRLYMYMAGHGIVPSASRAINQYESALLMADARPNFFGATYHVAGAYIANWFSLNGCFDEIFLFMDCCRGVESVFSINEFLPDEKSENAAKRCYVFGTKWAQDAREKPMPDEGGAVRGVFTKTLLMGLSGGAAIADPTPANPGQGKITVSSLKGFIYNNIETVRGRSGGNGGDTGMRSLDTGNSVSIQLPEIDYWPRENDGKDIDIATVPMPSFPVVIRPPAGQTGRGRVFRHFEANRTRIAINDTMNADWRLSLQRGLYYTTFIDAAGNDIETKFEVEGIDGEGVTLVTFN